MQLMIDIFNAGLGVSFCDFGTQILRSFDENGGTVHQIVGAASNSHREWLEKQSRTLGVRRWRREQISKKASGGKSAVFGKYRFKPRSECPIDPGYPRWLDVDADGNWVQLEKEVVWVQLAFRLAKDKGAVTISQALRDIGVTQARSDTPIKVGDVDDLLRNVAVMGWRQHFTNNVPIGDPVKGVYPAIITPAEFDAVQVALKSRNHKRVPNGWHRHNLFEAQTFCACYGAKLGLRNGRNGHAFYCSSKKNKTCDAPNIRYDEEALLNVLHHFRWADFFGSDKHDAELANALREVLTLTGELGALQDKV